MSWAQHNKYGCANWEVQSLLSVKMLVGLLLQDVLKDQIHSQKGVVQGQCFLVQDAEFQLLLDNNLVIYRFKQLKEEEKKKKLSQALPLEEVQPLASASDDGSDVENDKVSINLWSFLVRKFMWMEIKS